MVKNKANGDRKRNFLIFFKDTYSFFHVMAKGLEEKGQTIGIDNICSIRINDESKMDIVYVHTKNPVNVHSVERLFNGGVVMTPHDSISEFMGCYHKMMDNKEIQLGV